MTGPFGASREPESKGPFPLWEVISMPDGKDSLPEREERKKEEQGPTSTLVYLVPLFELVIRVLELALKILRIIN